MQAGKKPRRKKTAAVSVPGKPEKPYPEFPLFAHNTGRWAKKIKGKICYFGKWDDPDTALQKYLDEKDDLHAGRTPRMRGDGCTVANMCNAFMTSKKNKMDSGELSAHSFKSYLETCGRLIEQFGRQRRVEELRPDDFEQFRLALSNRFGIVGLKNDINRCRIIFKYAADNQLIKQPVIFGQSFDRPSVKMIRGSRNKAGPRMFESHELKEILDSSTPQMRAMVLLAINGGLGNTDIASLPESAIEFKTRWMDYPRPKTEINRRIPLWPETVVALQNAIEARPKPAKLDDAPLCFLTVRGNPWVRINISQQTDGTVKHSPCDSLSPEFSKMLKTLDINGRRGLGFYAIRHTFETIAGESKDQVAVDAIMGHVDESMAGQYRERISDERLKNVTDVVHDWLFRVKKKK